MFFATFSEKNFWVFPMQKTLYRFLCNLCFFVNCWHEGSRYFTQKNQQKLVGGQFSCLRDFLSQKNTNFLAMSNRGRVFWGDVWNLGDHLLVTSGNKKVWPYYSGGCLESLKIVFFELCLELAKKLSRGFFVILIVFAQTSHLWSFRL